MASEQPGWHEPTLGARQPMSPFKRKTWCILKTGAEKGRQIIIITIHYSLTEDLGCVGPLVAWGTWVRWGPGVALEGTWCCWAPGVALEGTRGAGKAPGGLQAPGWR